MRIQNITFTALPNGFAPDGRLRLSLFMAPRLSTDESSTPTLSLFADFLDFPTTSDHIVDALQVRWGSGNGGDLSPDPAEPGRDSALWQALFPSGCTVRKLKLDTFANRNIRSYPATNIKQFLQQLYTAVGLAPDQTSYPSADLLLSDSALGKFASDAEDGNNVKGGLVNWVEDQLKSKKVVPYQKFASANVGHDMIQVQLMHQPRADRLPDDIPLASPPVPDYDFHNGLALLGNHRGLLRRLGIVRDLLVDRPSGYTSETTIGFDVGAWSPTFPLVTFQNQTHPPVNRTVAVLARTRIRPGSFTAAPTAANPSISGRRLRLGDERYDVVDLDLDGAALKAMAFADTVLRATSDKRSSVSTPSSYSLPALRSEGLVVVEAGKAAAVQASLGKQKTTSATIDAGGVPVFEAEDLVRGYYVDIYDATTGHWAPTCQRTITYHANGQPPIVVEDEGPVTLTATSATKTVHDTMFDSQHQPYPVLRNVPDDSSDIVMPEVIAKWSGWSLVAPRPGKRLPPDDGALDIAGDTSQVTNIKLGITSRVPTDPQRPKLPSLRFGRDYRVRARAADIAGNSEEFSDVAGDLANATATVRYGRYEPVPAPVILPHEDGRIGSSVRRMVIRSNYDTAPSATAATIRHLAPPNASQLLVEQSGVIDRNGKVSATFYSMLLGRDGQRFDTAAVNAKHIDPAGPTTDGSAQYVYTDDYVKVPYLPDPFSRGVALYGLPFGTTSIGGQTPKGGNLQHAWGASGATFDTVLAARIRLSEPANITTASAYKAKALTTVGGPNTGHTQIDVYLPKASVVTIRVASTVDKTLDLVRLGIYNWLIKGLNGTPLTGTPLTNLQAAMAAGLHWMVTPYEELTLVHAVRQPLLAPRWSVVNGKSVWAGARSPGETVVHLSGNFTASTRSTSEVHVLASWTEPVDLLNEPRWRNQNVAAKPITHRVPKELQGVAATNGSPLPVTATTLGGDTRDHIPYVHELHDHKHRVIDYTLEALSAFAEEFVETLTGSFTNGDPVRLSLQPLVDGYTRIALPGTRGTTADGDTIFVPGIDYAINQPHDGWVQRLGSAIDPRDNLSFQWLAGKVTRVSTEGPASGTTAVAAAAQKATVNVLASARPAVPDIEYVMPAYAWQGWKASGSAHSNVRSGNTLRVWLARPWFSSGAGEQLAVICPTGTAQPDAQDAAGLHKDVTLIGQDPIWGTKQQPASATIKPTAPTPKILTATAANFPLAVSTIATGISIEGVPALVGAAIHQVEYDEGKGMWFCDIEIATPAGVYTPFVQLALARYQFNALHSTTAPLVDLRCSQVRVAEIAQLAPNRSLTITNATTAAGGVTVKVTGPSYHAKFGLDFDIDTGGVAQQLTGPGRMSCEVQHLRGDLDPLKFPDTAWKTFSTVDLGGTTATSGLATWTGSLDHTVLGGNRGSQAMRLVFCEYEQHVQVYSDIPTTDDSGALFADGRIVFAATYNLT